MLRELQVKRQRPCSTTSARSPAGDIYMRRLVATKGLVRPIVLKLWKAFKSSFRGVLSYF
jgi:hypothetical protein